MACIFCRIVAGEVPAHKVHETDEVLAFLDVAPLSRGHTLIVPKSHYRTIDEVPAATAAALLEPVPAIARALREATGMEHWNVLQNNGARAHQAVGHVHVHVIPKYEDGSGLEIGWPAGSLDEADAAGLASRLAESIAGSWS